MTKPSVAFVACIENNKLASETLLLFESIRKFGGLLSQLPIYSFNPRGLEPLKQAHYNQLSSLNVQHSDNLLNSTYREYAPANKIYSAAYAETTAKEEILVFLDSDSVILNEPYAFALPPEANAAVTPVWAIGIGSYGPKDPAHIFWKKVQQICDVNFEPPYLRTRLTQQNVSFYCNAGLIVARRSAKLFTRWRDCFEKLWTEPSIHKILTCDSSSQVGYGPEFFLEQVALSAALMPKTSSTILLDHKYNCPLHNRTLLQRTYPTELFDLNTIVHFHYNQSFHIHGFLQSFEPPLNPQSLQYKWLAERLPLYPEIQTPKESQNFIIAFEQRMKQWRNALSRLSKDGI